MCATFNSQVTNWEEDTAPDYKFCRVSGLFLDLCPDTRVSGQNKNLLYKTTQDVVRECLCRA